MDAGYLNNYIDLHCHLDGSITVDIAKKLAKLQGIELPSDDDKVLKDLFTVPPSCASLNDFLECFALPVSLLQTYESLSEAAYLVAEDMKAQDIVYAEIRYAPQLHTSQGMSQDDAVNAVLEGLSRSELKANVILCCMRGDTNDEQNFETIEVARRHLVQTGGVVALDLAGAEGLFPTSKYREIFKKAKDYGIPFTIHAGEADGPESVRLAVEYGAKRIGHGTRASCDEGVMNILRDNNIYIELCPTSERQTLAVEDMSKLPILEYMNRGIKVTINTDDPAIERTNIGEEYVYMENIFDLTAEQQRSIILNSIEAAFTTDEVKAELKQILGL